MLTHLSIVLEDLLTLEALLYLKQHASFLAPLVLGVLSTGMIEEFLQGGKRESIEWTAAY
jgi:hypothetical protein